MKSLGKSQAILFAAFHHLRASTPAFTDIFIMTKRSTVFFLSYIAFIAISTVGFESLAYTGIVEDWYLFITGTFNIIFFITALNKLKTSIWQRALQPFLCYLSVALIFLIILNTHEPALSFKMFLKGRIFGAYPALCNKKPDLQASAFVCYEYWVDVPGWEHERIVFDRRDELSRPSAQWSETIKSLLSVDVVNGPVHDCAAGEVKKIEKHIYRISSTCQRNP